MIAAGSAPAFRTFFAQLRRRARAGAVDYIYQIIIVILGVYLGITFERNASDNDRTREARAAVVQLAEDLKRDDADLSRVIQAQQSQVRDYAEIAQWLVAGRSTRSAHMDSLLYKVITTSPTVYPRRGLYSSMIGAGQFALLPRELRNSVVNLYENIYTRLTANGEHYDFALERDYMPAYARAWDPMRMTLITPDVAERVRFRNAVLIIHAWSQYYVNLLVDSQAQLRAVMTDIERNAQGSD